MARLSVRVQPGARREGLVGWMADGTLKVAVSAPPEGGKANEAVTHLLARALGLKPREVSVTRGHASRSKQLDVEGLSENELQRRLERATRPGNTQEN